MRGYYISFDGELNINIEKKVHAQMAELRKIADVDFVKAEYFLHNNKLSTVLYRIPILNIPRYAYGEVINKLKSPDFVYFRRVTLDRCAIAFFKEIKEKYPKCKIVIEIPTYPYNKEVYARIINFTLFPKELFFRRYYKDYIDRFVTYSSDDMIFGVPTIPIINGTDTDNNKTIIPRSADDEIHLLVVAMFQKHHGYERVIEGLHQYYLNGGNRTVKLYMVGEGPEHSYYSQLVEKYGMEDKVVFYGKLQGKELDDVYNDSDIGLGSFGFYKIGLSVASSLKIREYMSKGLPIIAGCEQDVFPEGDSQYYLEFPNNSTVVDIQRVITFFDSIYKQELLNRKQITERIHQFAKEKMSMEITFKPVIDYLRKEISG